MDGNRLLVVEEALDQMTAIDISSGATTAVVQGLDLGSRVVHETLPHGIFNGVTATGDAIYVTEDGTNAVYEFRR